MAKGMKHDATPAQQRMGKERQSHLSELVNKWILRRDKRLLVSAATVGPSVCPRSDGDRRCEQKDQRPGKDDNVVFCKLAGMQTRA